MSRIIACGGRDLDDYELVHSVLDDVLAGLSADERHEVVLIHGACGWGAAELAEGVQVRESPLVPDHGEQVAWTREAARFAIVLGLLLDAEGTPVRRADEPGPWKGWLTRHLTMGREDPAPGPHAAPARVGEGVEVQVRGHLKRQRHGPGNALVRWIYVRSYGARRWVAPRTVH